MQEEDDDDSDDGEDKLSSGGDEPEPADLAKQKRRAVFDTKEGPAADLNGGGVKVGRSMGLLTSPKSGEVSSELISRMNRSFRSRDGPQIALVTDESQQAKNQRGMGPVAWAAQRFRQLFDRQGASVAACACMANMAGSPCVHSRA
jgi:hypothetical protein